MQFQPIIVTPQASSSSLAIHSGYAALCPAIREIRNFTRRSSACHRVRRCIMGSDPDNARSFSGSFSNSGVPTSHDHPKNSPVSPNLPVKRSIWHALMLLLILRERRAPLLNFHALLTTHLVIHSNSLLTTNLLSHLSRTTA